MVTKSFDKIDNTGKLEKEVLNNNESLKYKYLFIKKINSWKVYLIFFILISFIFWLFNDSEKDCQKGTQTITETREWKIACETKAGHIQWNKTESKNECKNDDNVSINPYRINAETDVDCCNKGGEVGYSSLYNMSVCRLDDEIISVVIVVKKVVKHPKPVYAEKKYTQKYDIVSNSVWNGSVMQVEKYLERNLKDPDSYDSIEWSEVVKNSNGTYMVRHKYRARNGFGGMTISNTIFVLSSDGKVISTAKYPY